MNAKEGRKNMKEHYKKDQRKMCWKRKERKESEWVNEIMKERIECNEENEKWRQDRING